MLLDDDETVVKEEEKVKAEIEDPQTGDTVVNYKGKLVLTDHRVIFEQSAGLLSKKTRTAIDEPIANLRDVSVEGLVSKKLVLQMPMETSAQAKIQSGGGVDKVPVNIYLKVSEPGEWEAAIRKTV